MCLLKGAHDDQSRLIYVDQDLLYQVLVNMKLETAFKYCTEKKTVSKTAHGSKFGLALTIYQKGIQVRELIALKT